MILLCWCFPEDREEYVMEYTSNELKTALTDSFNFKNLYPGVLFVSVLEEQTLGEKECFRWNNPIAASLHLVANHVGAVLLQPLTIKDFAKAVGLFYPLPKHESFVKALLARPPSEEQFASPLPPTSKIYGGRNKSLTRRRRK